MNYYKKVAPGILKSIFSIGVPFRSKILALLSPKTLYKEGEYTLRKQIWYDLKVDIDLSYYIERQIFYYDMYEPEVISFIDCSIDSTMTCLDLGTNIGLHSLVMGKNAKKVISYEANPKIVKRLKQNIKQNRSGNITVVEKAISTNDGEIEFFLPDDNINGGNGSLGRAIEGIGSKPIKIKADSFSRILVENGPFDFIKIDVEGLEFDLIQSAISVLSTQKSTLLFEYNKVTWRESEFSAETLKRLFEQSGFELYEIKENYRKSNIPQTPKLLRFPSQRNFIVNIVAIHKEGKMLHNLKKKGLI